MPVYLSAGFDASVQAAPLPATSSVVPLQSSSMPLQVSGDFAVEPVHLSAPAVHCTRPVLQAPPPWQSVRLPVEQQVAPPPGLPSSVLPLQLLSLPSHTSA